MRQPVPALLIALALTLWALLPGSGQAQGFPAYARTTVTDLADLLDPAAEAELDSTLATLRAETGITLSVLTLPRRADYAPEGRLEDFATALFNHWGIGDATRNDGILVMILREDREMRIELGAGYAPLWDVEAHRIISRSFLPDFREDRYQAGIMAGVADVIQTIARPFAAGQPPPPEDDSNNPFGALVMLPVLLFLVWRRFRDRIAGFGRCPACGRRQVQVTREVTVPATAKSSGQGLRHLRCGHCGHDRATPYRVPSLRSSSSSSSSGFGGGRSSGGGASGRW